MDNLEDSNNKLIEIQERIIKTDEVLRLLDEKKKEANKLDKKYKKLLEKFSTKSNEVLNLQKECHRLNSSLVDCTEIHLSWGKENKELKTKYELLETNHNEYVNTSEKKYQSACQENVILTETCDNLKKKVEKFEEKNNKTKNVKKLNDILQDVKEQLKDSIHKYDELKCTSDKTISDLKQEYKILEENRNETVKQLVKVRLDCDELRKTLESKNNSPDKSKFKLKIENLETKLQSLEIERDIVNQAYENDISQLKNDHEKEKKILEEKLEELKKKISEKSNTTKDREKYFTELTTKHETEKKFLEDEIEKLKSKISEEAKKYEKELETKLNAVVNKIKETTGTQTDSPDKSKFKLKIENLQTKLKSLEIERDIVNQSYENDISQLKKDHEKEKKILEEKLEELKKKISEKSNTTKDREKYFTELTMKHEIEKKFLEDEIEKLKSKISEEAKKYEKELETKLNAVVNKIKETTGTQTDYEDIYNLEDILTEVHNLPLLMSPLNPASIVKPDLEDNLTEKEPFFYSISVGTDDIIPTFIDSFTQTCEVLNENQHNVKVKLLTDSCTQTSSVNNNDIDFKPLTRPIILHKNNILEEIPKNIKLKSRITKKYKNNKIRLLSSLRNSKLNLKCLLKQCNKFVYVSPSILKSEFKPKIFESEHKMQSCANFCCQHAIRQENSCSCSLQPNICPNRFFGQFPVYQVSCHCNHNMFCNCKNPNNYYKMRKHFTSKYKIFDEIFNSSDSEDDKDLRQILKEYKHDVIKKYISDKYIAKNPKKKRSLSSNNFEDNVFINNIKNKHKVNNKSPKSKQYISSTDSDSESDTSVEIHPNRNATANKKNNSEKNINITPKENQTLSNNPCNVITNTTNLEQIHNCSVNSIIDENISKTIAQIRIRPEKNVIRTEESRKENVYIVTEELCDNRSKEIGRIPSENIRKSIENVGITNEENIRIEGKRKVQNINNKVEKASNNWPNKKNGRLVENSVKSVETITKTNENISFRSDNNVRTNAKELRTQNLNNETHETNNKKPNKIGRIPSENIRRSTENVSRTAEKNIRRTDENNRRSGENSGISIESINKTKENFSFSTNDNVEKTEESRKKNLNTETKETSNRKLDEIGIIPSENFSSTIEENARRMEEINKVENVNSRLEEFNYNKPKENYGRTSENGITSIETFNKITEENYVRPEENNIRAEENIRKIEETRKVQNVIIRVEDPINKRPHENNRISGENSRASIETINKTKEIHLNTETEEVISKKLKPSSETTETNINLAEENIQNTNYQLNNWENPQILKTPFTLSKKQQSLLRKASSIKRGIQPIKIATSCKKAETPKINSNNLKRQSSFDSNVEYKKQKLDLFGLGSDSDESEISENESNFLNSPNIGSCKETIINENKITETVKNSSAKIKTAIKKPKKCKSNLEMENIELTEENICKSVLSDTSKSPNLLNDEIISPVSEKATKVCNENKMSETFKKLEKCKTPVKVDPSVEKICKSMLSNSSKIQSLLNNEITLSVTEKTKKVYKRPEKSKFKLPPCNKIKLEECQTNTTEIPSTSEKTKEIIVQGIEKLPQNELEIKPFEQLDLGLGRQFIRDVVTNEWDKNLIATVAGYFANMDPTKVARLIVNEAMKDECRVLDKSFTPPAPLLTVTQQKILVLLSHLEKYNLRNIHTIFLKTVERRLFSNASIEVMQPLVRLYVASCKLKYEIENVRMFCCNAAYYMGDLILPLMFTVLTMWADILPHADNSEDIPLVLALVHVIQSKRCTTQGYNAMNVNRFLSDCYGYKRGERSNEEVMNKLVRLYSENYSETSYTAIVILCKNMNHKWTYQQIKKHLIQLLENCNNIKNKSMTISLIQRLTSLFKKNFERDYIIDINNCLSKHIIKPGIEASF